MTSSSRARISRDMRHDTVKSTPGRRLNATTSIPWRCSSAPSWPTWSRQNTTGAIRVPRRLMVSADVLQNFPVQDEEPAIDPSLPGLWFLSELAYAITVDDDATKAGGRADGCHRGEPAV